ncbi:MAG: hypothetical protein M1457_00900 [bacterium]|nr:hypothetical protein [bacterium]
MLLTEEETMRLSVSIFCICFAFWLRLVRVGSTEFKMSRELRKKLGACLMSPQETLRDLLTSQHPLVMPDAYDALSARLIEAVGFKAV